MAYRKYLPFAALVTVAMASPVMAQSGSPARASSDVFGNTQLDELNYEQGFRKDPASAAEAYRMASRFATCVTRFDTKRTAAVLAADAGSGAEAAALTALARKYSSCIGATGGVPGLLLRGALAEALWTKGGSVPNPSKRTKVDMSEIESFFKTSPRSEMVSKVGSLPLGWVSRCQVMAMPTMAAAVLKAVPGSAEERAAAAALYSKSSVCGVQNLGDTIVPYSRATIADALYQDTVRTTKG